VSDAPRVSTVISIRRAAPADADAVADVDLNSFKRNGLRAVWCGDGSTNEEGQPGVRSVWRP